MLENREESEIGRYFDFIADERLVFFNFKPGDHGV